MAGGPINIDFKDAAISGLKGAIAGGFKNPVTSGIVSFIADSSHYLLESISNDEEVNMGMFVWYGVTNFTGSMLSEGIDEALNGANSVTERIVEEGLNTIINMGGNMVEDGLRNNSSSVRNNTPKKTKPYLVTIWDESIGMYREIVKTVVKPYLVSVWDESIGMYREEIIYS